VRENSGTTTRIPFSYADVLLFRGLLVGTVWRLCVRRWRSGRLHAAHRWDRAHVEFHAGRVAIV
jgi:hypothetical protein